MVAPFLPLVCSMTSLPLGLRTALGVGAGACLLCHGAGAQAFRLNEPLPYGDVADVVDFELDPTGVRVVLRADLGSGRYLFSRPVDGAAPSVRLNDILPPGGDVENGYVVTPDGTRVVYRADGDELDKVELYSVPIDGSAPPVKLSGTTFADRDVDLVTVSHDSATVVFRTYGPSFRGLFSAPVDGSAGPTTLFTTTVNRGPERDFVISPDDTRVAFRSDPISEADYDLFVVPIDGSAAAVQVSSPLWNGTAEVSRFGFSPTSDVLVYTGRDLPAGAPRLFSVLADGSAPAVPLHAAMPSGFAGVGEFLFVEGGARLAYRAEHEPSVFAYRLYSVPVDGSASPVELNEPLGSTEAVRGPLHATPDDASVVFAVGGSVGGLFVVPADGSTGPLELSGNATARSATSFGVDAVTSRAVFGLYEAAGEADLFSAPLDGSSPAEQLDVSNPPNADFESVVIDPAGGFVAWIADQVEGDETYGVAITGGVPRRFSPPLGGGGGSGEVALGGGRVVFRATPGGAPYAVWSSPTGSVELVELSDDLADGVHLGDVTHAQIAPGGAYAVYRADQERDEVFELFGVSLQGGPTRPYKLHADLMPGDPLPGAPEATPDGRRWVFERGTLGEPGLGLFSVPVEGGPLAELDGDVFGFVGDLWIAPDSARVLFDTSAALYSAPIAGGPVAQLAPWRPNELAFSPDGVTAAFTRAPGQLWSARVDGSEEARRLDASFASSINRIAVNAAGTHVAFTASSFPSVGTELFIVPLDGSAPPLWLAGDLANGVSIRGYRISPDGTKIVYQANHDRTNVDELYVVPTDASAPYMPLHLPLPLNRVIHTDFLISANGERVLFRSDFYAPRKYDLFSVPIDASSVPEVISPGVDSVLEFQLDSTGRTVFLADIGPRWNLYSTSVEPGATPTLLSPPLAWGGYVAPGYAISTTEGHVVYRVDRANDGRFALFASAIDGSAAPRKLSGPSWPGVPGSVSAFSCDGPRVVFIEDKLQTQVNEAFLSFVSRPFGRAPPWRGPVR